MTSTRFPGTVRHYGGRAVVPPLRRWLDAVVMQPDGCLTWGFPLNPVSGYASLFVSGKDVYAHRFAYEAFVGPIPPGLVIDHLCRNRACCNPAHLEVVTQQVNKMRGEGVAAKNARKTECLNGHPFAGENLRVRLDAPTPARECRTCNRERSAARRLRMKDAA